MNSCGGCSRGQTCVKNTDSWGSYPEVCIEHPPLYRISSDGIQRFKRYTLEINLKLTENRRNNENRDIEIQSKS
jgi:hypothetical protein